MVQITWTSYDLLVWTEMVDGKYVENIEMVDGLLMYILRWPKIVVDYVTAETWLITRDAPGDLLKIMWQISPKIFKSIWFIVRGFDPSALGSDQE